MGGEEREREKIETEMATGEALEKGGYGELIHEGLSHVPSLNLSNGVPRFL